MSQQSFHSIKAFHLPTFWPKASRLGHKRSGRDRDRRADLNCQKWYSKPQNVVLSSKSSGKGEGRQDFQSSVLFPINIYRCRVPASQKWLDICLLMGNSESIPCFVLLANTAFSFFINCHFLNPWPITFLWFSSQPNGE